MRITSRENPRVKQYILLRDKKSARKSDGLFVIEGARLALDAIKEGVKLEFAFFSDSAAEHFPDAVSALSGALGERLYSVDDAIAQKLAGTVATQGIIAVAARLDKNLPSDKIVFFARPTRWGFRGCISAIAAIYITRSLYARRWVRFSGLKPTTA